MSRPYRQRGFLDSPSQSIGLEAIPEPGGGSGKSPYVPIGKMPAE